MKIIEGLKEAKQLLKKVDDLKAKVGQFSAYRSMETPAYTDQKAQVKDWLQSISDTLKRICDLRVAIQRTNIDTDVTIEIGGKQVTKSIAAWIHRRRDLAALEKSAWQMLTDKGIQEGQLKKSDGSFEEMKIVRCYEAAEKDEKVALFDSEPSIIDAKLEIINAITDLIE